MIFFLALRWISHTCRETYRLRRFAPEKSALNDRRKHFNNRFRITARCKANGGTKNYAKKQKLGPRKAQAASRVGNGSKILLGADGRTVWNRRYRELVYAIASQASGGNIDSLTVLRMALCRRAAALICQCEAIEADLSEGKEGVDIDLLARMSSHLRRIAADIGLDHVKRDVTPTLKEIFANERNDRGVK